MKTHRSSVKNWSLKACVKGMRSAIEKGIAESNKDGNFIPKREGTHELLSRYEKIAPAYFDWMNDPILN